MTQEMLIMAAILVAVILLTFIGILSRYRKCKSDEVLVVYGKTGGEKKSAKLYHGGAAFVWPIIQGYEFLSMKPLQIDCKLTGALSAQNIRVDVPTTITVAISTDPEVMQNAAERMLGLTMDDKQNLITDVDYGYTRSDGNSSADPYVIPDRNRPCVFEPFVSSLDIGGVTCRIEAHVGGDEHVVAYGDGSLVEHNAIVVGKEIFAQVNVMPIVAKERRYDYEFFGCSTNDFPNEFFSFF